VELKQQVKNLREDLNMANIDSDRKSVSLLTKVGLHSPVFMHQSYQLSVALKLYYLVIKSVIISNG